MIAKIEVKIGNDRLPFSLNEDDMWEGDNSQIASLLNVHTEYLMDTYSPANGDPTSWLIESLSEEMGRIGAEVVTIEKPEIVDELIFPSDDATALSTDAQGHEHRGKGPGGGQFVSTTEKIIDQLNAIKSKADNLQPSDDTSTIMAEVDSVLSSLSAKEVITLAKKFQSWDVTSKKEAIEKIKRKVLEMQRARARIEY